MTAIPDARAPERVRIVRAPRWECISEAADEAVTRAGRAFEAAGVPVTEMAPPDGFDALHDTQDLLQVYEGRRALAWERERHGDLLSTGLRGHFARAEAVGFTDYLAARRAQEDWQRRFDALLEEGEVVLTASAPGEAPAGLESTGDPVFCRVWTLLHVPCITLPHGHGPGGLPLGVQLVAPRWNDIDLLAAARWLGEHLD